MAASLRSTLSAGAVALKIKFGEMYLSISGCGAISAMLLTYFSRGDWGSELCMLSHPSGITGSLNLSCSRSKQRARIRHTGTSELGHSLPGRADSRSSHVRRAPKAEVSRALRLLEALDAQQNF